jgi:hypothetical protein
MAILNIELDTDDSMSKEIKGKRTAPRTFQVVSTIRLDNDLRNAFKKGAGDEARFFDGKDYDDIESYIRQYFNDPAFLVVTAGGSVAFRAAKAALTAANTRFVSLLGVEPAANELGNCFGGVTLDSVKMNSDRVDYLVNKAGRTRSGIGLFCNRKSAMNPAEVSNWGTLGANSKIAYGGNAAGKNNASTFPNDFTAIHSSVATVVVSADPFFQDQKDKLIKAANDWIAVKPNARHVSYPSQDYGNGNGSHQPTTGKSSWYGPSLVSAYEELGKTAALARNAASPVGFSSTPPTKGIF